MPCCPEDLALRRYSYHVRQQEMDFLSLPSTQKIQNKMLSLATNISFHVKVLCLK